MKPAERKGIQIYNTFAFRLELNPIKSIVKHWKVSRLKPPSKYPLEEYWLPWRRSVMAAEFDDPTCTLDFFSWMLWVFLLWRRSVMGVFVKLLYLSSYLSMGCELDFDSFMTFEVHFYIILRTRFTMTFLIPVFPVCIMEIKSLRLLFKRQAPHPAPYRSRELCNSACLLPFKTLDQWLQPSILGSCF